MEGGTVRTIRLNIHWNFRKTGRWVGALNFVKAEWKNWLLGKSVRQFHLNYLKMKKIILSLLGVFTLVTVNAQNTDTAFAQEVRELSTAKWQWMADKNTEALEKVFHDGSKFVHMSGTWNKDRELEIIESGSIWYKQADVHDVVVNVFGDTAVLWNRITLLAHVRGNDVTTEFTVTEVYKKEEGQLQLLALTFSSVRDTHELAH